MSRDESPTDEQLNDLAAKAYAAMMLDDYRADLRAKVKMLVPRATDLSSWDAGYRDALTDVLDLFDRSGV